MLRTTAFPLTRNPVGMWFIPPVTNGLVCICVWLLRVRSRFFDQSCDFLRPGDVNSVTGARDFDLVTLGSFGIPTFEVRVDGSVFCRYQHPARFASPRSRCDDCFEIVGQVEDLRPRHERGLRSRQVSCEVLMKLRGVEISETVCRLLYRSRLAEITWETFSVVSFIFARIGHMGRDVDQTNNRWIRPGFCNYRSAITMSHKNAWSIL